MFKNVTLGQYYPGDSLIHNLDPRFKIVMALLLIVAVFLINTYIGFAILAVYYAIEFYIAKINPKVVLKSIKPLYFIIAFTFVINIFFLTGEKILFEYGSVHIYEEGVTKAIFIAIRLVSLVVSTSILTLTTSPVQLTDGTESLCNPLKKVKFPVHEMAMMMSIALRFIPTLSEETDRIMKAQTARGAEFDSGNIFKKAKNMIPLLVPLFVSAFKRADDLALAMESRCYHGGEGRTKMKVLVAGKNDYIMLVLTAAVVAVLIIFF